MALVRFIVTETADGSATSSGLLGAAYKLSNDGVMPPAQRDELKSLIKWFDSHVPIPERFNRSSSRGYYRRETKGISWFRDAAKESLANMHRLKSIAESNGLTVHVLNEERVGYVVYEDDFQVIAEPFADTKVRP